MSSRVSAVAARSVPTYASNTKSAPLAIRDASAPEIANVARKTSRWLKDRLAR
jgi:hypothetical protein